MNKTLDDSRVNTSSVLGYDCTVLECIIDAIDGVLLHADQEAAGHLGSEGSFSASTKAHANSNRLAALQSVIMCRKTQASNCVLRIVSRYFIEAVFLSNRYDGAGKHNSVV